MCAETALTHQPKCYVLWSLWICEGMYFRAGLSNRQVACIPEQPCRQLNMYGDNIISKCQRLDTPSFEDLWIGARVCTWICTECVCQSISEGELIDAYLGGDTCRQEEGPA